MTGQRSISPEDLGAWLVKGNADLVDLAGRFALDPWIGGWCVQPGYRTRMMRAGQAAVFWASGSRGAQTYGVWGHGRLTGPALLDPADGRWTVPLDVAVLPPEHRLGRDRLRADPRLSGLEVLRQPQGSNPSFLTVAQFAVLSEYFRPVRRPGDA